MARGVREDRAVDEEVDLLVEQALKVAMHEIRQPLAAVFALAEAARAMPGVPAEAGRCLASIIQQVQEVADAAGSVLGPPADEDDAETGTDVDEVIQSVLDGFAVTWPGTLTRRGVRGWLPVAGSRVRLRRCLVNVVDNAVRAAGPTGGVTVSVRRGSDAVRIVVEDDGPGFGHGPSGAGIGLALTRQALEAVGGGLTTGSASTTGGGRVALSLPTRSTTSRYIGGAAPAV
jgi:signal transduction histidine kinase